MIKLNEDFLKELGLGELPPAERQKMLSHIYETLEMRVGMKLASGMSDAQLDEFEGFINGADASKATTYLDTQKTGWRESADFQANLEQEKTRATSQGREPNQNAVISEYAALKWLETNFPDYKSVVEQELARLKEEIKEAAPHILEEANRS